MPSIRQILPADPQQVDDKAVEQFTTTEEVGFKTRPSLKVLHAVPSGDDRDQHDEDHKTEKERHKARLARLLSLVSDAQHASSRYASGENEAVAPAVSHRAFDQREVRPHLLYLIAAAGRFKSFSPSVPTT